MINFLNISLIMIFVSRVNPLDFSDIYLIIDTLLSRVPYLSVVVMVPFRFLPAVTECIRKIKIINNDGNLGATS